MPPTLTRLGLGRLYLGDSTPFIARLPRNLTRLDSFLYVSNLDDDFLHQDWALAPPDLTHFRSICVQEKAVNWLPRTATKADLLCVALDPSIERVRSLPPGLRRLSLSFSSTNASDLVSSLIQAAPKTLEELKVQPATNASLTLSVQQLRSLPSTLRILQILVDVDWNDLAELMLDADGKQIHNFWPPNLTSLSLAPREFTYMDALLNCLPASIIKLKINFIGAPWDYMAEDERSRVSVDASLFPKDLTSLTLQGSAATEFTGLFSQTIQHLDLLSLKLWVMPPHLAPPCTAFPDSRHLHTLKLNCLDTTFPICTMPSLTTLHVTVWEFRHLDMIPSTVIHLDIKELKYSESPYWNPPYEVTFNDLPSSLKSLRIHDCMGPWRHSIIDSFDFSSLVDLETLRILTQLNTRSTFSTLPRSLRTFETASDALVDDAANLPPLLNVIVGINWTGSKTRLAELFPPFAISHFPSSERCYLEIIMKRLRLAI